MYRTPPCKSDPETSPANIKPLCLFSSSAATTSSAVQSSTTVATLVPLATPLATVATSAPSTPLSSLKISFASLLNKVNTMSQSAGTSAGAGTMLNPNVKLTFVNNEEMSKFVGNPTQYDTTFSPGPKIEEFLNHFNAYTVRHNIVSDADKLIALRMLVHPSMGDARFVLSSLVDDSLGANITFQEVSDYLVRLYKSETSLNFFRACNNFIDLCKPKTDGLNDLMQFRSIEVATKELLNAYLDKPNQAQSQNTANQKFFYIFIFDGIFNLCGRKCQKY